MNTDTNFVYFIFSSKSVTKKFAAENVENETPRSSHIVTRRAKILVEQEQNVSKVTTKAARKIYKGNSFFLLIKAFIMDSSFSSNSLVITSSTD